MLEDEYLGRALPDGPPRRSPPTGRGDHVGVHRQQDGRFYVGVAPIVGRVSGDDARRARRPRRGARLRRGSALTPHQKLVRARRRAGGRVEALVAGLDALGLSARPSLVPPRHDGLHRHRVLQARDRRDQGARAATPSPSSRSRLADVSTCRHPDQPPRQRLPQLLRPHPGRRHRPQGPARHRRRRRAGGGLPGAPRRRARLATATRPASAATCAASRSPPTSCPTTSSASSGGSSTEREPADETFAEWAHRADEEALP